MQYYIGKDSGVYLAHHGVLGQKWGVRRFQSYGEGYSRKGGKTGKEVKEARKEAKKAAKTYQKEINKSYQKTYSLIGIESRLRHGKMWVSKHPEMQKVFDKKIKDVQNQQEKNRKETERLLKKMENDSRVVYKRTTLMTSGHDFREEKRLNDKYGKTGMMDLNSRTSVYGTGVKVRAKDSFSGRRKSYNDDVHKRERNTSVVRTYYY